VRKYLVLAHEAWIRTQVTAQQQTWLEHALQAERAQDWPGAFALWRDLLAVKPPLAEATAGLARCQPHVDAWVQTALTKAQNDLESGRREEAQVGYEKVLALFPAHADALKGIKRVAESATLLQKSKADRAEVLRCCLRAQESYRRGDLPGAVAAWEIAAKSDPQDTRIQAQWQRARREWDAAQEKSRRLAQTRYEAGLAAYQRGELDDARTAWKETLELDPAHTRARSNLKRMEMEMN
jgi:tetratricopeptide (TPR) repeat protein